MRILFLSLAVSAYLLLSPAVSAGSGKDGFLTPPETVDTAMKALKQADTRTFNRYVQHTAGPDGRFVENRLLDDTLDAEGQEFVEAVVSHLSYRLGQSAENGDEASVDIEISNSDLSGVIPLLVDRALRERRESRDGALSSLIRQEAENGKTVSLETTLQLVKKDGIWKIVLDDAVMNAICGGFFSGGPSGP